MKERLFEWVRSFKKKDVLAGVILSLILAALIQPFLVTIATEFWIFLGIGQYETPEPQIEFSESNTDYPNGVQVKYFEGIKWSEDYTLYRMKVKNPSNKVIQDLQVHAPLPGCVVYTNKEGPAVGGDYETDNVLDTRMSGADPNETNITKWHCSKSIKTDFIDPSEQIVVEFVVKDSFDKCDLLLGVANRPVIVVEYRWEIAGQLQSEYMYHTSGELTQPWNKFVENNPAKGTMITEIRNRKFGAFIPTNKSSLEKGMNECGATFN